MNSRNPMTHFIVAMLLGLAIISPAAADQCGDSAGEGGSRIACGCGDTVVTSTKLRKRDPVVVEVCPSTALLIQSDDITLNCNNKTLTGDAQGSGISLGRPNGNSVSGVQIRNCRITGFGVGIGLGFDSAVEVVIRNNRLVNNAGPGIFGDSVFRATIRGNRIKENSGVGILLGDGSESVTIRQNRIEENSVGIAADTSGLMTIRGNLIKNNRNGGVELLDSSGNRVVGNRVEANGGHGVFLLDSNDNSLVRNLLYLNDLDGMRLDGGFHNLVEKNKASRNDAQGINQLDVGGDTNSVFRLNSGNRNGRTGLRVASPDNRLEKNIFNRNGGDGICAVEGNENGGRNRGRHNAGANVSFTSLSCDGIRE